MYMFVFCYKMNLHAALFTMTSISLSGYQEEPQVTKITKIVTQHVVFVMAKLLLRKKRVWMDLVLFGL